MLKTNADGYLNTWPLGHCNNPIRLDGPIPAEYPVEFKGRPFVYMCPAGGDVIKVLAPLPVLGL